ncbi:MAG TPA: deoxynucleoside kinase [Chitinophagales bacterium]|nr:deoxynucleoside kinase [Chitinophagales bacterium]
MAKSNKPAKKTTQPEKKAPAKKTNVKTEPKTKAAPKKTAASKVDDSKNNIKTAAPAKPQFDTGRIVKHIAVAGNIGAGKTTLTQLLAKHFGWETHFEDVENNPYLYDFYQDMPRWAFNLQIYFLNSRFKQILDIQKGSKTIIQDRTIYEDAQIFAPNLHAMGLMSTRDFQNYTEIFNSITSLISPPDLLIYLRGSIPALVNQIQKRGREYEDNLRLDYLRRLNEYYEAWISKYKHGKLLIIDIDQINFAENQEDLGQVIQRVQTELYGLF